MFAAFDGSAVGVADAAGLSSSASRGRELGLGGIPGEDGELEDEGEGHGRRTGSGCHNVVAFPAFNLFPTQLPLAFHLLDAPLGFAGAP